MNKGALQLLLNNIHMDMDRQLHTSRNQKMVCNTTPAILQLLQRCHARQAEQIMHQQLLPEQQRQLLRSM
jgi:hypothetical protein